MEDLPFSIRMRLFNMSKYFDQMFYSNEGYKQRRHERIEESFPRFCPNCQFTIDQDHWPKCGAAAVNPTYCQVCDITIDSETCPECGARIYFRKVKSGVRLKEYTVFPN